MTTLVLFDIDGTLTIPMGTISQSMEDSLQLLKRHPNVEIGVVGGSDRAKAMKQLGSHVLENLMDHAFHENGCVYYRGDELMIRDVLEDFIAPDTLNDFIRFLLRDIADVCGSPWLTGTFIERRSCMLNVSPIGRSCTQHQREDFFEWDQRTKCRQQFVERIKSAYPDLPFDIAVGGQISVDIFPCGFNKTRCIQHLDLSQYKSIHFIGDQVHKGGNDHELFMDPRVIGHKTSGVEDTQRIIAQIIDGC